MKLVKPVKASSKYNEEVVFTPASVLDLLAKIEEFEEFDFGLTEGLDGSLQLQVNDSTYDLYTDSEFVDVEVSDEVVEEIATTNEETYETLLDDETIQELKPVESGIIKETLKTLAIGGLVRLGKHYLLDK